MTFTCTKENLSRGLTNVAQIAGRNKQLPALEHVHLHLANGVLKLTTTDLEVGARATVPGKVEQEGSCVTPARPLMEYVQQLPATQPITLSLGKKGLAVSTAGFEAQFPVGTEEDFPLLPQVSGGTVVTLAAPLFCQALSRALFSAARDDTRPEIHSVYLSASADTITAAATDSFRLAEERLGRDEQGEAFTLLLPLSTAQEIVRLFADADTVRLTPQESHIEVASNGLELTSRLVDGTYPNYQHIIPQSFSATGTVEREVFIRALKTLLVFLPRDTRRVELSVHPQQGTLTVRVGGGEAGAGDVEVPFSGEGEELTMLFNINYLLDGLQHLPGEQAVLKFVGNSEPAMFLPEGEAAQYTYVVMPIQQT